MKNYLQPGDLLTIDAPRAYRSGEVVVIKDLVGIACHDAAMGEKLTISTSGLFELPKPGEETFNTGDLVYFKDGSITAKHENAICIGLAVRAAMQTEAVCQVKLK
jgi:predicted RecA/RadA family phage recombinase